MLLSTVMLMKEYLLYSIIYILLEEQISFNYEFGLPARKLKEVGQSLWNNLLTTSCGLTIFTFP